MRDITVVFNKDACNTHQRELFNSSIVSKYYTWNCASCKKKTWEVEECKY